MLLLVVVGWLASGGSALAQPVALGAELRGRIAALRAEKASRSPAQRKVDSALLYAGRMARGAPVAPGVTILPRSLPMAADGTLLVDLRARVTPRLYARIDALGGRVVGGVPARDALRVRLPAAEVEALAALREVRHIRPAERAFTRASNVSEGDVAHRADEARSVYAADGSGVNVGVLSDGVDALAAVQASGDLPAVGVLSGQAGSGSEGTAMLEIVHDLAPGASLLFASAFGGQAQFAQNITDLQSAGADVIVDDVGYFAEPVFQDGEIAEAVADVAAAGAVYVSSAGNSGNLNDGTAGVWEGDWEFSGISVNGDPAHRFASGVFANEITVDSPFVFTLQWNDPQGAAGNDYDLLLVNASVTTLLAASTNVQDGDDDPFELIDSTGFNDTGTKLIVVRAAAAADRTLHLNTFRGELAVATAYQVHGHAAARDAIAVAAVDVDDAGPGGVFDGGESVQHYSSDGYRRVFFEADGTPITPGDFTTSGGELRGKPNFAAADCVSTATPGFSTFCGTSAAAPHLAAISALLMELGGGLFLPLEIRGLLTVTALDIEAPGFDRDSGAGIADGAAAAEIAALPEPSSLAQLLAGAALLAHLNRRRHNAISGTLLAYLRCEASQRKYARSVPEIALWVRGRGRRSRRG